MTGRGAVRVAHITTVDASLRFLLLNQLRSLADAGFDVVGVSSPGPHVATIECAGIRHIAVPMSRSISPLADLVALLRLYRIMRREQYTIVHTHTPKAGLLGQLAARMARVPVVVNTVHGFYFHDQMHPLQRGFYILLEKLAATCSDAILSQNREDIETAVRRRISPPERIRFLGNGIDISLFDRSSISTRAMSDKRRELGLAEDAPVVGFVGRLAGIRKGFLAFLEAGQTVIDHRPDTRFLVVGEADHGKPDAVEPSIAAEMGIEQHCIFVGQRPNHELPLLYALMDLLVLPSLFEGMPRAIMEAAAMGVPAIATDVKGNREAVVHEQTGLLVPYGDRAALASAIERLLGDRETAQAMGQRARVRAENQFDERLVFERVKTEYTRLLSERGLQTSY